MAEFVQVDWELCKSTGELFAVVSRTDVETPVDALSLNNALQSHGYHGFSMATGAMEALVRDIDQKGPGRYLVAQRMDADVTIAVSADAMLATITTTPSLGGKRLTEARLRAAIEAHDIVFAVCDEAAIAEVLSKDSVTDLPIATGTPMVSGEDSRFVPLVESVVNVPLTEDAAGRVNFREILEFRSVDPGTPLMRLESPSAGTHGSDVFGRVIPAEPGVALSFPSSVPGAAVAPDDPTLLLAEINGHPLVLDDCVQVDNVLTLDAVDVATGNVSFGGSVLVKGDVASGARIEATGDVVVKGIVDKATIKAGNNIEIGGGVFGEEVCEGEVCEFAAHLTAGGSISALFMSSAFVSAAKLVIVKEYIAHCNVNGKRGIHLGQEGGKGCVIGGKCRSDTEVLANVIGTDANVPTSVAVGYRPKLRRRYRELEGRLSKLLEEQTALQATLQHEQAKADLLDAAARREAGRIANTLKVWDADIARIGKDILRARKRIDALEHARVIVKRELHPNAVLKINGQTLKIKAPREYAACYVCRGSAVQVIDVPAS